MRFGSKKITGSSSSMAADQQALGVIGVGGHHRLEARNVGEDALRALRVRLAAADAAAAGRADGHRRVEFARAAVAQPRQFADDLVEAG
jgi:hypothetical protein